MSRSTAVIPASHPVELFADTVDSPIGPLEVVADARAVCALEFADIEERLHAPLAAEAQQVGKVYRMASLSEEPSTTAPGQGPLYERLRELGWVYGQNIVTERRAYGDQMERIPELAAELIRSGVDIFIVPGGVGAVRVQQVTRTIPIVTFAAGDLVQTFCMLLGAVCITSELPVTRAVYTVIPIANALALFCDCFFTRPVHIETARAKENLCRKDLEPHRNHA
jgi:hypothetical protein